MGEVNGESDGKDGIAEGEVRGGRLRWVRGYNQPEAQILVYLPYKCSLLVLCGSNVMDPKAWLLLGARSQRLYTRWHCG